MGRLSQVTPSTRLAKLTDLKQLLEHRGHIYTGKHEGWYSVTDETFYPQSGVELIQDPKTGRKMMVRKSGRSAEFKVDIFLGLYGNRNRSGMDG